MPGQHSFLPLQSHSSKLKTVTINIKTWLIYKCLIPETLLATLKSKVIDNLMSQTYRVDSDSEQKYGHLKPAHKKNIFWKAKSQPQNKVY